MRVLLIAFLFISCTDYPKYSVSYEDSVPDSLKDEQKNFIIEATKAASFHMTGGDYEDPEDVIWGASKVFEHIYSVRVDGLYTVPCHGCYGYFTPEHELTEAQRKIYNDILKAD